jgi:hypothetical protein
MSKLLEEELVNLSGYKYRLWEFSASHLSLTLHGHNVKESTESIHLHFAEVYYLQMPTNWTGDFTIGSDEEFIEIFSRAGLHGTPDIHKDAISLFKTDTEFGAVYLLGALISIERNAK